MVPGTRHAYASGDRLRWPRPGPWRDKGAAAAYGKALRDLAKPSAIRGAAVPCHGLECGRAGRNRHRHACQRARRGGCLHMPGKYTAGRQQAKARSGHATIPQMRPALSQVFSSRRKLRSRTSVIACQEYEAVGTPATGKKKRRWIIKRGCSNPQVVFTPCLLMKPSHLLVEAV